MTLLCEILELHLSCQVQEILDAIIIVIVKFIT